ncbi:MAG: hypothetical protein IJ485_06365 [Lachnospiraceae bacterium]|nr:hypothetical protein [Lachnospiraceae bacterium]
MNIVAHNLLAMNAQRQFGINSKSKAKSMEKLSSGYKINRAADDAAGLAISEKMRRQVKGLSKGVENSQDGISLCQVADGALAEVNDMLHRITELSVKAANGTNTELDREYIQEEVTHLLAEIDRVSDATTFNELPIFKGTDKVLKNADGSPVIAGKIPFSDFKLADVELGRTPFSANSGGDHLNLRAIVDNPDLAAHGKSYGLIFGNGSTSHSSMRITYEDANGTSKQEVVNLRDIEATNYQYDDATKTWSRDFNYQNADGVDVTVTQKVSLEETSDTEKNYNIDYDFTNNGAEDIKFDFMFHVDTAYNNNDRCEGYYINGDRLEDYSLYVSDDVDNQPTVSSPNYIEAATPGEKVTSFSVVDIDNALAFSEKITVDDCDYVSMGHYNQIWNWNYYEGTNLDRNLGQNAIRSDLGFSLMWTDDGDTDFLTAGSTRSVGLSYGIVAVESDNNLQGVQVKKDNSPITEHEDAYSLWVHSGCEAGDGIWLEVGEMNTEVLGLKDIDVSTVEGASAALGKVKAALSNVSGNRSTIGAQQNRLERTIANEENIVENTAAAESKLRDADMATEMTKLSVKNILEQAGYSMMAQANQSNQGVLNLLQ